MGLINESKDFLERVIKTHQVRLATERIGLVDSVVLSTRSRGRIL